VVAVGDEASKDFPGADLADALRVLREQLTQAMNDGAGEELKLRLRTIEVEFEVALVRDVAATTGVRFWVVSAEGKAELRRSSTHRLKLEIQPVKRDPRTGRTSRAQVADDVTEEPR